MSRLPAAAALLCLGAAAFAGDEAPHYECPAGVDVPKLDDRLDAAARTAVATIRDPASQDDAEDAVRVLAALGRGALPHVIDGLAGADWYSRSSLLASVAEMDAPDVTPLLVAACGDPAFAVREVGVRGLGKTGDARGASALEHAAAEATEPAWRVRAAAATALRRAVLRGVMDRPAAERALVRLLTDSDEDVRSAAVREIAPLAADAALPVLLETYADPAIASSDRTLALAALRAYRTPKPELLAALRRGFLEGSVPAEMNEAGNAYLAMAGVSALDDPEIAEAIVHALHESEYAALRDGVARLGRRAAPWLRSRALAIAERVAIGRALFESSSFDEIVNILIQVDEPTAVALLTELLTTAADKALTPATCEFALSKVELYFAPRMRAELRALFDGRPGDDLRPALLRSIVASGGDDLAERLDAALGLERKVRTMAVDLLNRRPDLPAGPRLVALAHEAADPAERGKAVECLARRDPEAAARIASEFLDDPRAGMRDKAISWLSASHDPSSFERLLARLPREDGTDVQPARPAGDEPKGTTPSEHRTDAAARRGRLVRGLVGALRTTGGERARAPLLEVMAKDPDPSVRGMAAAKLRGIVRTEDAAKLVALEAAEPDPNTRTELLATLAGLGSAPEAVARFETLVADERARPRTISLLAEKDSSVVPRGLEEGLRSPDWTDQDRIGALAVLRRGGRSPDAATLSALVTGNTTLELCEAAALSLASRPGPEATEELVSLLKKVTDDHRLSVVVRALGSRGAPEAEAPLLEAFAAARDRAQATRFTADGAVDFYRTCAEAVSAFGSDTTGEALVDHMLDTRLAHAVARTRLPAGEDFRPGESAPDTILRTLVAAFARRDETSCRRLVASRLAALAAEGRDVALPESFVASVARWLKEPLAYRLPARPRPAAAALLWELVTRIAPRMSDRDLAALQAADDQASETRRYADGAAALRAYRELADVELATRSPEERLGLAARIAARTAQALSAEGKGAEALAVARALRDPDPTNGELAFRKGWCLARIGHPDAEARESLAFATAQDDKDARIQFQIGWVTEQMDGAAPALRAYDQAVSLDQRRVEERPFDPLGPEMGEPYKVAAYRYWYARALRAAGDPERARVFLVDSVGLDDRLAVQAHVDPAFAGWDQLDAAVEDGLDLIRDGAMR